MGSSFSLFLKVLFGAIAMMGFVLVFLVGTLESGATDKPAKLRVGILKHDELMGKEKLVHKPELGLSYMISKRGVPKGPDPIHNRKAGNRIRPPGQAYACCN